MKGGGRSSREGVGPTEFVMRESRVVPWSAPREVGSLAVFGRRLGSGDGNSLLLVRRQVGGVGKWGRFLLVGAGSERGGLVAHWIHLVTWMPSILSPSVTP